MLSAGCRAAALVRDLQQAPDRRAGV